MKKIALATLLSAIAVAPAFAADNGFYAGLTLGQSAVGNPFANGNMTKKTDTVYGVLGGYQFTKNWGAEAFFTGAGKWTAQSTGGAVANGKGDTWGIAGVGTLPLNDSISLYGKLGYASTKSTASGAGITGATRGASSFGVGAVYNATPSVGIRLGWDRYGEAVTDAAGVKGNFNADTYTLGAVFKF